MNVKLVQPLGDRLNVYLSTPRHDDIVAQVSAHARLRVGDSVPVAFDMGAVHFFTPGELGVTLASNRERWGSASPAPAAGYAG